MDILGKLNINNNSTNPESLSIDTSSLVVTSGSSVGVGTASPSAKLHILDTTSPQLRVGYDGLNYVDLSVDSSGDVSINSPTGSLFDFGRGNTISSAVGALAIGTTNTATAGGGYALAIGRNAIANANSSIAIGDNTSVLGGGNNVVIGGLARGHSAGNAVSVGYNANGNNLSVTIGANSSSSSLYGVVVGATASGSGSGGSFTAVGYNAVAGRLGTAIGFQARAANSTNVGSVALGYNAIAFSNQAIAIGYNAGASDVDAISIGAFSDATNDHAIAIGKSSQATGINGIAIGERTYATNTGAITIGYHQGSAFSNSVANSVAFGWDILGGGLGTHTVFFSKSTDNYINGTGSLAIGHTSPAAKTHIIGDGSTNATSPLLVENSGGSDLLHILDDGTFELGVGASANDVGAVTIGQGATTSGAEAIAIGQGASASNTGSIAIGPDIPTSQGNRSIAIGRNANSTANHDISIGTNANAVGDNSQGSAIAIGRNANAEATTASPNVGNNISIGHEAGLTASGTRTVNSGGISIGHGSNRAINSPGNLFDIGQNSIAIGRNTRTSGSTSVAIGVNAWAYEDYAHTMGKASKATGTRSFMFGVNSSLITAGGMVNSTDDSVAFGWSTVSGEILPQILLAKTANQYISGTGNLGIGAGFNPNTFGETATATLQLGTTGTSATLRYVDGNQQSGYVLTSDTDGNATWQVAPSGGGSFTGNTSGDCITDLYVTNIYGCSPLHIEPSGVNDVYIVENGGNVGIGAASPTTKLTVAPNDGTLSWSPNANNTAIHVINADDPDQQGYIDITTGVGATGGLRFSDTAAEAQGYVNYNHLTNEMSLGTNGSPAMTIGSNGAVDFTGGHSVPIVAFLGGTQTLDDSNYFVKGAPILISGNLTVNLPSSPTDGQMYVIRRINSSAQSFTVSGNGKNIRDAAENITTDTQFTLGDNAVVTIIFDSFADDWWVVSRLGTVTFS